MLSGADCNLYVITGVPVYDLRGKLYWDDVWELDVITRLPFWKKIVLISPVRNLTELGPTLVDFPSESIQLFGVDGNKPVPIQRLQIKRLLRRLLGDEVGFYEFAGTSSLGKYGFRCAVREGETKRIITFDAPIELMKIQIYSQKASTSLWKKVVAQVVAPFYLLYEAHFRSWAVRHAMAVLVVGNGIVEELSVKKDCVHKIISAPLSLEKEDEMLSTEQFEEFWQAKAKITRFTIMCADRLASEKGVIELVKAIERRSSREEGTADAVLHLYSSGPSKEDILSYVCQRKLSGLVTYAGKVCRNELIESMRNCDLFVTLTKTLDFNRTMIEAAGQGCAIVGSNLPGPKSFFKHADSAWLVDPTNPDEICMAIDYLLVNFSERKRIASTALSVAKGNSAEKVKARIMNWYLTRFIELDSNR